MRNFENKWIFVSGSRRGIGRAIVSAFARRGGNIIAHARKQDGGFEGDMAEEAARNKVEIRPIYFELTDTEVMKREIKTLLKEIKPDVLVNNAGQITGGKLFALTPMRMVREIFEIDLFAQMALTQLVLKEMLNRKSGNVINIASIAGIDARPGITAYGTAKAALIAWTKILAGETGHNNIRVNAIAPGMVKTGSETLMGDASVQVMLNDSAMHRLAKPEEVAEVACFLASDEASFINGEIIRVDGGTV